MRSQGFPESDNIFFLNCSELPTDKILYLPAVCAPFGRITIPRPTCFLIINKYFTFYPNLFFLILPESITSLTFSLLQYFGNTSISGKMAFNNSYYFYSNILMPFDYI